MKRSRRVVAVLLAIFLLLPSLYAVEVDLDEGWNLISGAESFEASELASKCPIEPIAGEKIWTYENSSWKHPDLLKPSFSYYVLSEDSCSAELPSQQSFSNRTVEAGWNLLSAGSKGEWSCQGDQTYWKRENGSWQTGSKLDKLKSGQGYWVRSEGTCRFNDSEEGEETEIGGKGYTIDDIQRPEYFVSPEGESDSSGTIEDPWSLSYAFKEAEPGEVVTLLPGNYNGYFDVDVIGLEGEKIVFRAEEPREVLLTGSERNEFVLEIKDTSHVTFRGIDVRPGDSPWFSIDNSDHVTLNNVRFTNQTGEGFTPGYITGSSFVELKNSYIRGGDHFDNIRIYGNDHLKFVGNAFGRSKHNAFGMYQSGEEVANSEVVIRGNVFAGVMSRGMGIHYAEKVLFENNIVTNGLGGPGSGGSRGKFTVENGIFRFNRGFMNRGGVMAITTYSDGQESVHNKFYNNVWDDNNGGLLQDVGVYINSYGDEQSFQDTTFENSVFSRNGVNQENNQIYIARPAETDAVFRNNIITSEGEKEPTIRLASWVDDNPITLDDASGYDSFSSNLDVNPGYRNASIYDHAPEEESLMIDGGEALTRTVDRGSGRSIEVKNADYFYDGFGIQEEKGDPVQIGDEESRIENIDYSDDTITLKEEIDWEDGEKVSTPWSGKAPDLGVYETGNSGRPSVQIVKEKLVGDTGENISFRVELRGGIEPKYVDWQFGDGETGEGIQVEHSYQRPYDYPVRVRVIDSSGSIYRGTAYVLVNGPETKVDTIEYNKEQAAKHLCENSDSVYRDEQEESFECG